MFNQLHQPPRFSEPRDDGDSALIEAQAGLLNRAKIMEDDWAEMCRQYKARWQPVADQMGMAGVNVFLGDLTDENHAADFFGDIRNQIEGLGE